MSQHTINFKNNHNGISYDGVKLVNPIEATFTHGINQKWVLEGTISLERMTGSWKFGDQLQIVVYGNKIRQQVRVSNNKGYERIEIALPLNIGKELLSNMVNILKEK